MAHLRRVLAPMTAIWLFCQVGTLALVPVALWVTAAAPHAAECTCGHGDGPADVCPMHHRSSGNRAPCAMQAAHSADNAVLTTIVGATGILAAAPRSLHAPDQTTDALPSSRRIAGEGSVPPDSPPPRA